MNLRTELNRIYPDGLPIPRRLWSLVAIWLAISMSVLDTTIANVALPSIARDFGVSNSASIWVINAYQIAILVSLLPLAALGETVGYRRISQAGLMVFTLASLGCALMPSVLTLSLARVIQGFGAAGIMSVSAALIRFTVPQRILGRVIGINAVVVAISAAVGPTVASAVLAVSDWRWLFAINIPLGVITLLLATYALPHTERSTRRLDRVAVFLSAGTFVLLIGGVQALAHDRILAVAALQIAAGGLFAFLLVRYELHERAPLLPLDLLRLPPFSFAVGTSVCAFVAQMAALVALPFEIQHLGYSPSQTGLLMTPWPVGVGLAALVAGRLADEFPAAILSSVGLAINAAGLLLLALLPHDAGAMDLVWRMALCGIGFGFFQSPNNRAMLSVAPRARSGAAGGMLATSRLLGQSLGAAAVAILFRFESGRGASLALGSAAAIAVAAATVSALRSLGPGASEPRQDS